MVTAVVTVPLTAGELLQGIDGHDPLLVSLPVTRRGRTVVRLYAEGEVTISPWRPRAEAALRRSLDLAGWRGGAHVDLETRVRQGLGFGSSTVDVAGVILGVAGASGRSLSPHQLVRLMTEVEPSDSSPLPGAWLIDHVRGSLVRRLGSLPAMHVTVVAFGPAVDTLTVHATMGAGSPVPAGEVAELAAAVSAGDLTAIGAVATRSALRNQERLPKPVVPALLEITGRLGLPGVVIAHSGNLAGILAPHADGARAAAAALASMGLRSTVLTVSATGALVSVDAHPSRRCETAAR